MAPIQTWSCLDVDCDYVAFGTDEDAIVAAAMDHARAAHGSFELEEMILAALDRCGPAAVPADAVAVGGVRVPSKWAAHHDAASLSPEAKKSMEWSPKRGFADL